MDLTTVCVVDVYCDNTCQVQPRDKAFQIIVQKYSLTLKIFYTLHKYIWPLWMDKFTFGSSGFMPDSQQIVFLKGL